MVPAIETDGLTKRFGSGDDAVLAVEDLDLTVEEGEIFGFLGPNGAGKSTTIDMLLGFSEPTDGSARVLGDDVLADSRAIRRRIGLLPEGYGFYENLTGRELVASAIETKGVEDDPDALIDRVGLDGEDARRAVGGYSKGMEQRLALAVALVGDPDLLILDEPSSGLDPKGVKLLRRIVREERDRGATVFFSSHILEEVEKVCDRVGILNDGRLVAIDTIDDLRAEIGAESTIEATVGAVPDLDPVRSVDGVREATADGGVVRIACRRPAAKMPALRRLDDATTVEDVAIEDASLEALFERYTGGTGDPAGESADAAAAAPTSGGDSG